MVKLKVIRIHSRSLNLQILIVKIILVGIWPMISKYQVEIVFFNFNISLTECTNPIGPIQCIPSCKSVHRVHFNRYPWFNSKYLLGHRFAYSRSHFEAMAAESNSYIDSFMSRHWTNNWIPIRRNIIWSCPTTH